MTTAALVGSADFNRTHFQSLTFEHVIAVDGGFTHLSAIDVTPDCAVGDFDSLGFVPDACPVRAVDAVKDFSDMHLGLQTVEELGGTTIYIYGGLSGRLDHTFATIQVMRAAAGNGLHVVGIGDDFALTVIDAQACPGIRFSQGSMQTQGSYERYLSLFSFDGSAEGVCIKGLKYELTDDIIPAQSSMGLSNEFTGSPASVQIGKGSLVVVFPLGNLAEMSFVTSF